MSASSITRTGLGAWRKPSTIFPGCIKCFSWVSGKVLSWCSSLFLPLSPKYNSESLQRGALTAIQPLLDLVQSSWRLQQAVFLLSGNLQLQPFLDSTEDWCFFPHSLPSCSPNPILIAKGKILIYWTPLIYCILMFHPQHSSQVKGDKATIS